jgi:predicted acetyltransferase
MESPVRLRAATSADRVPIADLMFYVFHETITDELRELEYLINEFDRSVVADDDGLVVGHATVQSREITIPGAVVPAAHVTGVGVSPTHRRRGILSAMMRHQLTEIAEAGREPIAVLWASEAQIYPRFGYGPAAARLMLDVLTREIGFTEPIAPAGRLRLVEPTEAKAELAALHDRLRTERLGWSSRSEQLWRYLLSDHESHRKDATALRGVVCDGPDGPTGYALWRVADGWDKHGPDAEVRIREVVAADPATYATLWQFLFGIDLARRAVHHFAAVDEPLQYLVNEPRKLRRTYTDSLWVRIIDLPTALEARRYLAPVDVVFDIDDPLLPANAGRWRLTASADKATCVRTEDPADFACSITELGAAYLGGTSLASLAAAGRIRRLTTNLPSAAFAAERLPHPIEVF